MVTATGGDAIVEKDGYTIHTFTDTEKSNVLRLSDVGPNDTMDILVVGGGGGGGEASNEVASGGGGGGEVVIRHNVRIPRLPGVLAKGGDTVYEHDGHRIHVFTGSSFTQNFDVLRGGKADVYLVGGGGGGGTMGGGGAGEMCVVRGKTLANATRYIVKVGEGGTGGGGVFGEYNHRGAGFNGGITTFGDKVAIGGGGGGGEGYTNHDPSSARDGGSGGGGGPTHGDTEPGWSVSSNITDKNRYGNDGGMAYNTSNYAMGGGGGGASDSGLDGAQDKAGDGGAGLDISSELGVSIGDDGWFGGGGGGGIYPGTTPGTGGKGGGGIGAVSNRNGPMQTPLPIPNTGGGGGGAGNSGGVGQTGATGVGPFDVNIKLRIILSNPRHWTSRNVTLGSK